MLRILGILGLGGLIVSCGAQVNSGSSVSSLINKGVEVVQLVGDSSAQFAVIVTGSDEGKVGYRINCGSNFKQAGKAFGYRDLLPEFMNVVEKGTDRYNELNLNQQPTFNCQDASDKPQVFALYGQDAAGDPLTTHYAKFPSRPLELYALGCQNQLDFFTVKSEEIVRITAGSLSSLLPAAALKDSGMQGVPPQPVIKPMSCFSDEDAAKALVTPSTPPSVTIPAVKSNQTQAWKVANTGDWPGIPSSSSAFPYLVSSGGFGFAVGCGTNTPSLFGALGAKGQLSDLQFLSDERLKNSQPRQQPVLRCDSTADKPTVSKVFRVVNDSNKSTYVQFAGYEKSLIRLGCSKLQQFFGSNSKTPIDVTKESLKYLAFPDKTNSESLVELSCSGVDIEEVKKAFVAVFGVSVGSDGEAIEIAEQLNQAGGSGEFNAIVNHLVNGRAWTPYEVNLIVYRAFRAVYGKEASNREAEFLKGWISKREIRYDRAIRPHHDELLAYLRTITLVSEADLKRSCLDAFGWDCGTGGYEYWIPEMLSRGGERWTYDRLVEAHVEYNLRDEQGLKNLIANAVKKAYNREPSASDYQTLTRLIRNERKAPAQYSRLVDYLRNNPLWVGEAPREERVNGNSFTIANACNSTATVSILIYTTGNSWETQVFRLNPGTRKQLQTNNRYFYYHFDLDNGALAAGLNSNVQVLHKGQYKPSYVNSSDNSLTVTICG